MREIPLWELRARACLRKIWVRKACHTIIWPLLPKIKMVRKRARLGKIQVFKLGRYLLLDKVMCGFLNLDMDVSLFWTLKGVFFYLWKISVLSSYFFWHRCVVFFLDINWSIYFFYPDHRIFFSFLDTQRCILVHDIIQKVYFSPLTYLDVCLFWTLPWTYV